MEASNGFWQGVQQGGAVTMTVALVLLLMSVLSWVVIVYKALEAWQHRRMMAQAQHWCGWNTAQRQNWRAQASAHDPYGVLVDLGLTAVQELATMRSATPAQQVDPGDWISQKLQLGLDRNAVHAQIGRAHV